MMRKVTKVRIERWSLLIGGTAVIQWVLEPLLGAVMEPWRANCATDGQALAYAAVYGLLTAGMYVGVISGFIRMGRQVKRAKLMEEASAAGLSLGRYCISQLPEPHRSETEKAINSGDIQKHIEYLRDETVCDWDLVKEIQKEFCGKR